MVDNENTRVAIVRSNKCKPKKCRQECKKSCPVVTMGRMCIEVTPTSGMAWISEEMCTGCGICVKKCPFDAISIINLPKSLDNETSHRYGPNAFKLHRLPVPRLGQVLGLVGSNGTGKTTALKILSGRLQPNLGRFEEPPSQEEILKHWRGSGLQNYLRQIADGKLHAVIKPQYVDNIHKTVKGTAGRIIDEKAQLGTGVGISEQLDLCSVRDREVRDLSGGELQRFAIAIVAAQRADTYIFDEPSSFLDVRQRLNVARVIRSLINDHNYIICVEHDLAVLDYLSDFVCCLYGESGAYGVVTMPYSVREGINVFLAGYIPAENVRFRSEALTFKVAEQADLTSDEKKYSRFSYPNMTRTQGSFKLDVENGDFTSSEIIVLLGENGCGKTTFVRLIHGQIDPDFTTGKENLPQFSVSYKPQKISPKFAGTVRELLNQKIPTMVTNPQFKTDVIKPLRIEMLFDQPVKHLSGGELQRVAITLVLGKPADVYLIDEPSAYLDSEQRIIAAKVIKRFIMHAKKTAFIVEHDFIMAAYMADRVIVFEGEASRRACARAPQSLLTGMNLFLKNLDVTFRRDPTNYRPRINKVNSVKDTQQKLAGSFYYLDD